MEDTARDRLTAGLVSEQRTITSKDHALQNTLRKLDVYSETLF